MCRFFSMYWYYIKIFFKSRLEYRMGFFMALLSNAFSYAVTYLSMWVIINQIGSIGFWDFSDISILFGLNLLCSSISSALLWYTVFNLGDLIISGKLDILLLRPEGLMRQLIWQRFGDTAIAQIVISVVFITVALFSKIEIMSVYKIVYLLLSIVGGVMIQSGMMILVGSICFWTYKSNQIGKTLYYDLRSLAQYPLSIYPNWIIFIMTFLVPWAFVNYYPSLILLNKSDNFIDILLGIVSPVVGFLFLSLSYYIFKIGIKKYSGIGG